MSDVITVKDLCLWYGENQALKNININIPEKALLHLSDLQDVESQHFLRLLTE